jgi:Telomere resolvase ResT/TelK catalytic domain
MTFSQRTQKNVEELRDRVKKNNKSRILKELNNLLAKKNFTDASLVVAYSEAKKIFALKIKDKTFLSKIKAPEELMIRVNASREERQRERVNFNVSMEQINTIKKLSKSKNTYDRAIYLLFVSGRRTTELLNAHFFKAGDNIKVEGLVKRSKNKRSEEECLINTIIEEDLFLKEIEEFQDDVDKMGLSKLSFNRNLNRRIKRKLGGEWKPHSLRGAYALYMFEFYNIDDQNRNGFIRKVLCHQSDNASLAYIGFQLEDGVKNIFEDDATNTNTNTTEEEKQPENQEEVEQEKQEEVEQEVEQEEVEQEMEQEAEEQEDLSDLTVKELRKIAKERGKKGYSKLTRPKLLSLLGY